MYQSGALFGSMTMLDNVALPLEEFTNLPAEAIRLIAMMKLHRVGLSGVADRMPAELSGGMQKRGAIARAMALDPSLLFLDELSAGLDPVTSAELDQLVSQNVSGHAVHICSARSRAPEQPARWRSQLDESTQLSKSTP